ncbi:MAG: hypothetical protein L0H84_20075 [Pseudonocardia sp.]|nr:hypothetical protein [Pseudonocardia sp.]
MTWLTTYSGGDPDGRVNLAHVERMFVQLASSLHLVRVRTQSGSEYWVSLGLPTEAEALAKLDDLILNGA